jgi:hypothetical protein
METKEIKEGDYIRGFKSKNNEFVIDKKYIGLIAKVIEVGKYVIQVQFSDGNKWYYDIDRAIKHLVGDDMIEFEKGLDANAKDSMKDIDKYLDEKAKNSGLNKTPIEELESHFKDNINPEHYKSKSKETIERLQDNLTQGEFKGYLKGNILKYLDRYEHKNGVEDLNKAQWYLNKLIELENE